MAAQPGPVTWWSGVFANVRFRGLRQRRKMRFVNGNRPKPYGRRRDVMVI